LPEAERGRKTAATSFRGEQVEQPRLFPFCSPSPLRGGGWGEGFCKQGTGCWDWSCTAPVCYDRSGELDGTRRGILFYFRSGMEQFPAAPVRRGARVRRLAGVERLRVCYQQAVGHELPNQLVALQGTARLLEQDAGDRLDPETRADLTRLAE